MRERSNLVEQAFELVESAQGQPAAVHEQAEAIIRRAPDTKAAAIATWARALSERELGHLTKARGSMEEAVQASIELGDPETTARMRDSLAFTLFLLGQDRAALRQTELAARHLSGPSAARLKMQQGLILQRLGETEAALRAYRQSLAGMARAGDKLGEVRLRINRSNLHTYRWDLAAARADLERAHTLATELKQTMLVAGCEHNLGFVAGRTGNVPAAMDWYSRARETYRAAGVRSGNAAVLEVDQAQLLLEVGLSEEAFKTAQRAVTLLGEGGNEADRAEATLLAARAALASQRVDEAGALAAAAGAAFARQHRSSWRSLADYVALQARFADLLQRPDVAATEAVGLARAAGTSRRTLSKHGWHVEALHATTIQARGLLAAGRPGEAKRRLDDAQRARKRGPVDLRLHAWHATALLRAIEGNPTGALRALSAGLRILDNQRATLGAAELRASAAQHADDLVDLGISLALQDGRASRLLGWADRSRAGAIHLHPVTPPTDPRIAAELTELRRLEQEAAAAALSGGNPEPILRRRAEVEERIRRHARLHQGQATSRTLVDTQALQESLKDRALVEYLTHRGVLHAIVVRADGMVHHNLGPLARLADQVDRARFDLMRLAHGQGSRAALAAAQASLTDIGTSLEERLIAPLEVGESELVIVPSGQLHGLPWRVLPGLTRRPFAVAPSAQAWMRAARTRRSRTSGHILVVAGPDLDHATREVAAVARLYRRPTRLSGRNATVRKVLAGLEQTHQAHIVAHGRFRPDNPMFSSIVLADGSLTVFDMEQLRRVPEVLTLPACDAAVTEVRPGDEILGLAAALLALGVKTLTVPQVPISDTETPQLMRSYHRNLAAGAPPTGALAAAVAAIADGPTPDPQLRAAAQAFVVMGA